ncbi:GDSL-type esterase/lipase family protein [Corynebacterium freneyi]|uniref:GDSL-type esterase/lipase family protein n=1 Tax=Corynebacterium freneyi TaxID=134034 RepID=UPI001EF3BB3C|nr:GDSL-type esterase/lipase family protein [Corynebacterium freneyi]MCG7439467.1 GDSL-type esterase/lipase family protein [Corynebacterium freneyi]
MRIRSVLATLAATAVAAVTLPMAAQAAPGNTVVFGDSLPANPTVGDWLTAKGAPIPGGRVNEMGCGTDFLFSNAVGAANGKPVADYTCAGSSFRTGGIPISEQINRATATGALDRGTREVVILAGANDTYPYILNDRMPMPHIQENLRVAARDAINQIKHVAPQAKVKIAGYPTVSGPNGEVCLINTGGVGVPTPAVNLREIEDRLDAGLAQAAGDTGVQFVSLKDATAGHGTCDADNWVVGVIDDSIGDYNLFVHMTNHGVQTVGDHVGRA